MGKKERHASKVELRKERGAEAALAASLAPPKRAGFKAGWGWGVAALGLAVRHPIFFSVPYVGVALLVGLAALNPWLAPVSIVLAMLGVVCLGEAARAMGERKLGHPAPWGAWIAPLRGWRVAGSSLAKAGAMTAGLAAIGWASNAAQGALGDGTAAWFSSGGFLAFSLAMLYALVAWVVVAGIPEGGAKAWLGAALRAVGSPMALAGFAVFWFVWQMLCQVLLSLALATILKQASASVDASQLMFGAIVILVALNAPLVALGGGLGAGDLSRRHRMREAARLAASSAGPVAAASVDSTEKGPSAPARARADGAA